MANFGFERLRVVAPYAPHWREARSAIGAPELLENAKEFATLADAVEDCTLVIGTGTLAHRKPEQRVVSLSGLTPMLGPELNRGGRVALVFGPEKHGLTREDLSWCHLLVEIPTDARQPSMNLGQAAAVFLYELASRANVRGHVGGAAHGRAPVLSLKPESLDEQPLNKVSEAAALSGKLDLLAGVIAETMAAAHYSPASMRAANRHDLRLLLRRLAPTERDTRRILGLFRRILWRMRKNGTGE